MLAHASIPRTVDTVRCGLPPATAAAAASLRAQTTACWSCCSSSGVRAAAPHPSAARTPDCKRPNTALGANHAFSHAAGSASEAVEAERPPGSRCGAGEKGVCGGGGERSRGVSGS